MKLHTNITEGSRGFIFKSKMWKMGSSLIVSFAALMFAIGTGGLTGCGGGPSGSGTPSDPNVCDAVKRYCEHYDISLTGMLDSIKLPDRPVYPVSARLVAYGDKVTISDVRVVKRGKPFHQGSGEDSMEGFPVRVHVKGMRIAGYGNFTGSMGKIVHAKDVNLPFEGETDFVISFTAPDKTHVDAGPGEWVAHPVNP